MEKKHYNPEVMPSFNFYKAWIPIFRALSPTESAVLLNWICWYCFEESEPDDDNLKTMGWRLATTWEEIKPQLESQLEKWRDYCTKYHS